MDKHPLLFLALILTALAATSDAVQLRHLLSRGVDFKSTPPLDPSDNPPETNIEPAQRQWGIEAETREIEAREQHDNSNNNGDTVADGEARRQLEAENRAARVLGQMNLNPDVGQEGTRRRREPREGTSPRAAETVQQIEDREMLDGHPEVCPHDCNGQGYCFHGRCFCLPKWKGPECATQNAQAKPADQRTVAETNPNKPPSIGEVANSQGAMGGVEPHHETPAAPHEEPAPLGATVGLAQDLDQAEK